MTLVREAMLTDPKALPAAASAQEAGKLLTRPEVRAVLVVDGESLVGLVTPQGKLVERVVAAGRDPRTTRRGRWPSRRADRFARHGARRRLPRNPGGAGAGGARGPRPLDPPSRCAAWSSRPCITSRGRGRRLAAFGNRPWVQLERHAVFRPARKAMCALGGAAGCVAVGLGVRFALGPCHRRRFSASQAVSFTMFRGSVWQNRQRPCAGTKPSIPAFRSRASSRYARERPSAPLSHEKGRNQRSKRVGRHSFAGYHPFMDIPRTIAPIPAPLPKSESLAVSLLWQTRVGRRQWAAAQALAAAPAPLPPARLIAEVEACVGRGCSGGQPAYTLQTDIRALKQAGLLVRYSRAPGAQAALPPGCPKPRPRAAPRCSCAGSAGAPSDGSRSGSTRTCPRPAKSLRCSACGTPSWISCAPACAPSTRPPPPQRSPAWCWRELADVREAAPGE